MSLPQDKTDSSDPRRNLSRDKIHISNGDCSSTNKSGKQAGTEGRVTGNLEGLLSGITSLHFKIPCVAKIQKA